jgi:hypothetical protein
MFVTRWIAAGHYSSSSRNRAQGASLTSREDPGCSTHINNINIRITIRSIGTTARLSKKFSNAKGVCGPGTAEPQVQMQVQVSCCLRLLEYSGKSLPG